MDRDKKKRYLNQYLEIKRSIDSLTEEYHFWSEMAKSVPSSRFDATGVHGNLRKDPILRHIDICQLIQERQDQAAEKLTEILDVINKVPDAEQCSVLKYRYINGLYFHEIANKMNYSLDNIFVIHRKALDAVEIPLQ